MVREIRLFGDPILRKRCRPVEALTPQIRQLAQDMVETMFAANGLGLAAPQVGEDLRMIVINLEALEKGQKAQVLVNPEVVQVEGKEIAEEGCLSFPGLYLEIPRPYRAKVRALELRKGELVPVEIEAEGLHARALLHEIDHLNGVLFIDYLDLRTRARVIGQWKRKLQLTAAES